MTTGSTQRTQRRRTFPIALLLILLADCALRTIASLAAPEPSPHLSKSPTQLRTFVGYYDYAANIPGIGGFTYAACYRNVPVVFLRGTGDDREWAAPREAIPSIVAVLARHNQDVRTELDAQKGGDCLPGEDWDRVITLTSEIVKDSFPGLSFAGVELSESGRIVSLDIGPNTPSPELEAKVCDAIQRAGVLRSIPVSISSSAHLTDGLRSPPHEFFCKAGRDHRK